MPGLIVSIRARTEIDAAIAGGATLLDVKEPRLGSLGRADSGLIRHAIARLAGRLPVSAAMGELRDSPELPSAKELDYLKWGLSGYGAKDWRGAPSRLREDIRRDLGECRPVVVVYADWQRAQSPRPDLLCDFACARRFAALLIDTWKKDRTTLIDWMNVEAISEIRAQCRSFGVKLA